jgi:hypothetical protein
LESRSDLEPAESVVEPRRPLVLAPFTAPPTPSEPVASDATEPGAQSEDLPIYRWFANS